MTPKAILQEDVDEEEEEQSGEKTFSTKNATIGEDAQSVTPQQTGEANKDPSSTGNEGGEPAATAAPVEDNKTQEQEGKEKVAEEGQATRPKSKNSQKSLKQEAAERKSVGGGSKAGEKVEKEEDAERAEEGEEGALPPGMVEVPIYMNKVSDVKIVTLSILSRIHILANTVVVIMVVVEVLLFLLLLLLLLLLMVMLLFFVAVC